MIQNKYSIKKYLTRLPKRKTIHFEGFCANCSHPVNGAYCSNCGQSVKELQRSFWSILSDSLSDAISFDNKFFHTLLPLFIKPGFLTKEFMEGRRARYTPPFRLYLFLTFFAFLLLSFNHKPEGDQASPIIMETGNGEKLDVISFLEGFDDGSDRSTDQKVKNELRLVADSLSSDSVKNIKLKKGILNLNATKESAIKNDSTFAQLAKNNKSTFFGNKDVKKLIEIWKLNPSLLMDNVFKKLSQTLLIILPFFAGLLAFFYIRQKRYFIEHLLISLNFHSFIFVIVILSELLILTKIEFVQPAAFYLYLLIPIQLFLALKFYYKQSWLKTLFKFFVLSFFYNILLFTGIIYSLASLVD